MRKNSKIGKGRIGVFEPAHPAANSSGYVLRYRVVMEKHLGRLLTKDEHVHHINENPLDDRLENLKLTTRTEHPKLHRVLPYDLIEELMEEGMGYKRISKALSLNVNSVRDVCRKIRSTGV